MYDMIIASRLNRDVAQPGSAHAWGAWGRRFKSCHPDFFCSLTNLLTFCNPLFINNVAQHRSASRCNREGRRFKLSEAVSRPKGVTLSSRLFLLINQSFNVLQSNILLIMWRSTGAHPDVIYKPKRSNALGTLIGIL